MIKYSFFNESYDIDDENYDEDFQVTKRKFKKNWHVPQSRQDARLGTVGSFSSITQKPYNNVYGEF